MVGFQPDAATITAVAAVGTTLGYVGLATERHGSRSPVASVDVEPTLVDELGPAALGHASEPTEDVFTPRARATAP